MRRLAAIILSAALAASLSGVAWAQDEVIYLTESGPENDNQTQLYSVTLVPGSPNAAILTLVLTLDDYNQIDAIACDGDDLLWAVNKGEDQTVNPSHLISIDPVGGTVVDYGTVTDCAANEMLGGVVLAAVSPVDGLLYIADQDTNALYTIDLSALVIPADPSTAVVCADFVGVTMTLGGTPIALHDVDVLGADMAFDDLGNLYLYTNAAEGAVAPRGLYQLDPTTAEGEYVGPGQSAALRFITGLAITFGGAGTMLASRSVNGGADPGQIVAIDHEFNGGTTATYTMFLEGSTEPYHYLFGDMTICGDGSGTPPPPEPPLCNRTIGYYKTHSWNGETITICGVTVTEDVGQDILWAASGKNFSMLFAQLIAAKLNVNNDTSLFPSHDFSFIDEAEDWLCHVAGKSINDFADPFDDKTQKRTANEFKNLLDDFNNAFHCN